MSKLIIGAILAATAPTKRGVIFSAFDYNVEESNFKRLSSNDGPLLQASLKKQGFEEKNLALVSNPKADDIRKHFERLISETNAGDIVYVHYSGHGFQLDDDNGDEEGDDKDEALAPIGASSLNINPKDYIRDDEIQKYLGELRRKASQAGHILMSFDNCHSGSMTRSRNKARSMVKSNRFQQTAKPASYVVLEASKSNEEVFEVERDGVWYGPLALALSRQLGTMQPEANYHSLFQKVKADMKDLGSEVEPQVDGILKSRVLTGGLSQQRAHFIVEGESDNYWISGARFNGLEPGSLLELHPAGTEIPSTRTLIAKARVVETSDNDVRLEPDKWLDITDGPFWAFPSARSYKDLNLTLHGIGLSQNETKQIRDTFAKEMAVEWVSDKADISITKSATGYEVRQPLFPDSKNQKYQSIQSVKRRINDIAQGKWIKNIKLDNQEFDLDVGLYRCNEENGKTFKGARLVEKKGVYHLKTGDMVLFAIRNIGETPGYPAIINIDGRRDLHSVYPFLKDNELLHADKMLLDSNRELIIDFPTENSHKTKCFGISKTKGSSGREWTQIFLTEEHIKFYEMQKDDHKNETPSMRSASKSYIVPPFRGKSVTLHIQIDD